MEAKLVTDYTNSLIKMTERIEKEPNPVKSGMLWLEGIEELLDPIYQAGIQEGKRQTMVIKPSKS